MLRNLPKATQHPWGPSLTLALLTELVLSWERPAMLTGPLGLPIPLPVTWPARPGASCEPRASSTCSYAFCSRARLRWGTGFWRRCPLLFMTPLLKILLKRLSLLFAP